MITEARLILLVFIAMFTYMAFNADAACGVRNVQTPQQLKIKLKQLKIANKDPNMRQFTKKPTVIKLSDLP